MLLLVAFFIKLLEFWGLVNAGHAECINPLSARLGVERVLRASPLSGALTAFTIKS